jgi:hypothetical protein
VTRDRARKKAIRARMAATGEPYSAAARGLDAAGAAGADAAGADAAGADTASASADAASTDSPALAAVVIARANATLAAPRARIEVRVDRDIDWSRARPRPRVPRPVARLARFAAEAAWKRVSPEMDLASAGEELKRNFRHSAGEGFVEPAADRYQLDFGGYAQMHFDGGYYGGASGRPLRANNHQKPPDNPQQEPLDLLRRLRDATDARPVGHETVRGTPCRVVAVQAGSLELTVWTDDEHVRRVQSEWKVLGDRANGSILRTLELWDFGAEDSPADWTRLPDFRSADSDPDPDPGRGPDPEPAR